MQSVSRELVAGITRFVRKFHNRLELAIARVAITHPTDDHLI